MLGELEQRCRADRLREEGGDVRPALPTQVRDDGNRQSNGGGVAAA
jgi:hypothetical protein